MDAGEVLLHVVKLWLRRGRERLRKSKRRSSRPCMGEGEIRHPRPYYCHTHAQTRCNILTVHFFAAIPVTPSSDAVRLTTAGGL